MIDDNWIDERMAPGAGDEELDGSGGEKVVVKICHVVANFHDPTPKSMSPIDGEGGSV